MSILRKTATAVLLALAGIAATACAYEPYHSGSHSPGYQDSQYYYHQPAYTPPYERPYRPYYYGP